MTEFVVSVLGLFDRTLQSMMGVGIFVFFLSFFLCAVALGVFLMLKDAAQGKSQRRGRCD